jgi:hypothetical protein
MIRRYVLCLAASCLPVLVHADNPEHDALRACAKMSDQAQRLACFDDLVSKLPQLEADRFGMTVDIERKRDPLGVKRLRERPDTHTRRLLR